LASSRPERQVADLLRTAMVLLADHELTSSACRAHCGFNGCVAAGMPSRRFDHPFGPLHGDASGRVRALFSEVERLGEDEVLAHYLSNGLSLQGLAITSIRTAIRGRPPCWLCSNHPN
jgi:citrate synthase